MALDLTTKFGTEVLEFGENAAKLRAQMEYLKHMWDDGMNTVINGMASGDQLGTANIDKARVVLAAQFIGALFALLNNAAPTQANYNATVSILAALEKEG